MHETAVPTEDQNRPRSYVIRIQGHLDARWAIWFAGLTITPEGNGETHLAGPVADQAVLYGLLKKIRDLGMPLLSVNCGEADQTNTPNFKQPNEQAETNHDKHN
jgi:hypothetical protein